MPPDLTRVLSSVTAHARVTTRVYRKDMSVHEAICPMAWQRCAVCSKALRRYALAQHMREACEEHTTVLLRLNATLEAQLVHARDDVVQYRAQAERLAKRNAELVTVVTSLTAGLQDKKKGPAQEAPQVTPSPPDKLDKDETGKRRRVWW